jgi:hypothetical protein
VINGDTLGLFFLHVYDEVLRVDRVGSRVLDEHLVAADRSVAGVDEHVFIILFLVPFLLTREGRIVE